MPTYDYPTIFNILYYKLRYMFPATYFDHCAWIIPINLQIKLHIYSILILNYDLICN